MTIHSDHPFLDPDADPVRQLRGRLGGAVTLWTAGSGRRSRAGLTVSSLMVAGGADGRLLALLDPDSDLRRRLEDTGRGVVHLLQWEHRQLAEAFAGQFPAPGGPFAMAEWEEGTHGPRLISAPTWALVEAESFTSVGWSDLATTELIAYLGKRVATPLEHRRGRYRQVE